VISAIGGYWVCWGKYKAYKKILNKKMKNKALNVFLKKN